MPDWVLYIVRCRDGSLYTGITTDLTRRLQEHQSGRGRGANYLRGRGPLELQFTHHFGDRSAASRAEYAVKQLSKQAKEHLAAGLMEIGSLMDQ
jgi:putative endonuclease